MAATGRTTIAAVWASFFAHMEHLLNATGDGSTKAILAVKEGDAPLTGHPIPYILVQFLKAQAVGRIDKDKEWICSVKIRVVSEIELTGEGTAEILSKVALVQDRIESFQLPEGSSGFSDIEWAITHDTSVEAGNIIMADSVVTYKVNVAKGAN